MSLINYQKCLAFVSILSVKLFFLPWLLFLFLSFSHSFTFLSFNLFQRQTLKFSICKQTLSLPYATQKKKERKKKHIHKHKMEAHKCMYKTILHSTSSKHISHKFIRTISRLWRQQILKFFISEPFLYSALFLLFYYALLFFMILKFHAIYS